jgi:hypothetical protein
MKTPPLPGSSTRRERKDPAPPKHLQLPERRLWASILRENVIEGEAALSILKSTLEAHQRARLCREQVDREGSTYLDRFEQPKPHPLLAAERDARASFVAGMRALRLDMAGDER